MIPEFLKDYHPTFQQYKDSRKRAGIPNARAALHNAKYNLYRSDLLREWKCAGGEIIPEYEASDEWERGESRVRIVKTPDDCVSMDDLKGECFNPDVNDNINRNRLAREEREFEERVQRDGVWGYRAEFWNGQEWVQTDSIFGFVGGDFTGSGYDDDLMSSALDALREQNDREARAVAATIAAARPDLAPAY